MQRILITASALAISTSFAAANENNFTSQLKQVEEMRQLPAPATIYNSEGKPHTITPGKLEAIYFDSLPFKGKPTRSYAWIEIPKEASETNKVPAIVLVHGGGGTAFKKWAQLWAEKGYAAISIAVEGQIDKKTKEEPKTETGWARHAWAGPQRSGVYGDSDAPLEDQWMYHAVADTVIANSLMRSLPYVDKSKTGIMGVSWGGIITSTVMGIDDRFAFAIPVYGCGGLSNSEIHYGRLLGKNLLYQKVWDPLVRMDKVKMPTMWYSWPNDSHFGLDELKTNYDLTPQQDTICLVPNMGHGHGPAWKLPDGYAFADSIVNTGKSWGYCTLTNTEENKAIAEFHSTKPLTSATLLYTKDTGFTGSREWLQAPAQLKQCKKTWKTEATLPKGTKSWVINVKADELTLSSNFMTP